MRIRITAAERRGRIDPLTAAVRRTLGITEPWPAVHCSNEDIAIKFDGKLRIFDIPRGDIRPCGWDPDPDEYARKRASLRAQRWSRACSDDEPCVMCGTGDFEVKINEKALEWWKTTKAGTRYEVVDLAGKVLSRHEDAGTARRNAGGRHAVIETPDGRDGGPHVFDAPGDGITWPPVCGGCRTASSSHAEPGSYVYDEATDEWSCGPCRAVGQTRSSGKKRT